MKIIHLQACTRRFLAQNLVRSIIKKPGLYLRHPRMLEHPSCSTLSKTASDIRLHEHNQSINNTYVSKHVNWRLAEFGEFVWGLDSASEKLVQGVAVEQRPEEVLQPSLVKYTGEWRTDTGKRHGRGTLIWPDGARYDGYFVND